MNSFLILGFTVCLWVVSASGSPLEWTRFKAEYNKVYPSAEDEAKAFDAFSATLKSLEAQNELEGSSFERGINSLADMSFEDYKKRNTLLVSNKRSGESDKLQASSRLLDNSRPVPESMDWSEKENRVGPVKDQGQCGSCWSFATTGLLEGQEYLNSTASKVTQLSEQQFISCDSEDLGCRGGDMTNALYYAKESHGVETERDYPYLSGSGQITECEYKEYKAFVTTRHLGDPKQLPKGDEEALRKVVARYGPVAVAMDASHQSFQQYISGVYYESECGQDPMDLDHAVLVVGYGTCPDQGDYWLVKNSWGPGWGSDGYFKIARNRNNHCGIATAAVIVQ